MHLLEDHAIFREDPRAMLLAAVLLAASPNGSASLGDRITAAVSRHTQGSPTGAAVGVVRNGRLIYVKGFGMRDIAAHKPVDAETRFEIGSVTKQFTAAAILQLKEHGKLALDDSLATYLPSFPHARDVSLRQLLNQVSGLQDYFDMKGSEGIFASTPGSLDKVAAYAERPLHFKPGTQYEYSNTNYYVLGRVIEIVARQSYEAYVRDHLFAAAGMSHSDFMSSESKLQDFAIPYQPAGKKGAAPSPPILESWAGGAGAVVSTVADLARWDTALAGGRVVSRDDFVLMSTPFVLSNGSRSAYGMGLTISEANGHKRVWHSGQSNGSSTMNATYPSDHVGIIVFENTVPGDTNAIEAAVFEQLFPAAPTASAPANGEDPVIRLRVLHFIEETRRGAIPASEMSPQFQKIATPDVQQHIAQQMGPLGPPKAVVFVGKGDRPGATRYTYRAQFAHRAATFIIIINKTTHLLDAMGLKPE